MQRVVSHAQLHSTPRALICVTENLRWVDQVNFVQYFKLFALFLLRWDCFADQGNIFQVFLRVVAEEAAVEVVVEVCIPVLPCVVYNAICNN